MRFRPPGSRKEDTVKIAVSANGPTLEAAVDPRFGRAPYLLVVDPDTLEFEAVANHCGPKAFQTLRAAGIPVIVEVSGPVREAVEQYRAGQLAPAAGPNATSHW